MDMKDDAANLISTKTPATSVTGSTAGWLLRPITALVRALSLLKPALVLDFLSRAIDHVAAVVHSRGDKRRKVLAWLRDTLPEDRTRDLQNISNVWQDGSLLCSLVHTVVPGYSPTRNIDSSSFQHGQLLVCKYLGVPPAFSEEDTRQHTLTSSLERRLLRYLSAVRQAAVPLMAANAPMRQNTRPSTPLAVARGMGLLMAAQGRRAVFYLYPLDREEADHFVVQIQGPGGDFGSALIPARSTVRRSREHRRASFILKPWFSTTRNSNIPIEWKVNPGSICVSYVPQSPGKHELCVTRRGCHLMGSPYTVTVERSTAQCMREDEQWLSEEELEKRREFKKKLKVVLRIVDFVTEKMVLTDDGKLMKLSPHHSLGMRALSMPDLFSRLKATSQGERRTRDDIKLRDKSPSQEPLQETHEDSKSREPSCLQQKKEDVSEEASESEHSLRSQSELHTPSHLQATDIKVEIKSKRKPTLKEIRNSLKHDKDHLGRKVKNVVSLCNYLVHNTPRQRSLEILNAAGCILDGRPIRLSKDVDILLMTALGRQVPVDSKKSELLPNEISENTLVTEDCLDTTKTKKSNRKVSFVIPDRSESPRQDSQTTLSCGHKREKLPSYLRDTGQKPHSQKCMKCVRADLSGLNIISQLNNQSFDEPVSPQDTLKASPQISSVSAKSFHSNTLASPRDESTTYLLSSRQNEASNEDRISYLEDKQPATDQILDNSDFLITTTEPKNNVSADSCREAVENITSTNTGSGADFLTNVHEFLEAENTLNKNEHCRSHNTESRSMPLDQNTLLTEDITTSYYEPEQNESTLIDEESIGNNIRDETVCSLRNKSLHSKIKMKYSDISKELKQPLIDLNNRSDSIDNISVSLRKTTGQSTFTCNSMKGLEQILEYSTLPDEGEEKDKKEVEPNPQSTANSITIEYDNSRSSEYDCATFQPEPNDIPPKDCSESRVLNSEDNGALSEQISKYSISQFKTEDNHIESLLPNSKSYVDQLQNEDNKQNLNGSSFQFKTIDPIDEPQTKEFSSAETINKHIMNDYSKHTVDRVCSTSKTKKTTTESSVLNLECATGQSINKSNLSEFPPRKLDCATMLVEISVDEVNSLSQNDECPITNESDATKCFENERKGSETKDSSSAEQIPEVSQMQLDSNCNSSLTSQQKAHCSKNQTNFADLEELLRDSPEPLGDFSLWSSDTTFGAQKDETEEYSSVVNFDSILSAPNLEEALKIFEEDIQRAQEESRSNTTTEDASPVNVQPEGERDRSDSDYISMEDARSSQEHSPENQQNRENMLVDVNEWMRDRGQLGPAEREIWGMMEDCEPNRFYPRVLSPGIPDLECITEEGEEIPNEADSRKKRSPPNIQVGSSQNNESEVENKNKSITSSQGLANADNSRVSIGDLLEECFESMESNETVLETTKAESAAQEDLLDFSTSGNEVDETTEKHQELQEKLSENKIDTATNDSNCENHVMPDKCDSHRDSNKSCGTLSPQSPVSISTPEIEITPCKYPSSVPIIIIEDTDFVGSDDNSSCDDVSDPEIIAEEFNALAGLTERSSDGDTETKEPDVTSVYGAPVKVRVTHWKHYWDGKMAEQKRKEEGKVHALQKTIKKFTSQYLKSCSSKPVKRRSPTIRIHGIVNKWRKTFEDPLAINEQDNHPIIRVNRVAKQWNKFFENETKQESISNDEEIRNITSSSEEVKAEPEVNNNIISENKTQEMKKPEFTIRVLSPEPIITTSHVSKRKQCFEIETMKQTETTKVSHVPTTNHVAKCKQFWDSLSKGESTESSSNTNRSNIPEALDISKAESENKSRRLINKNPEETGISKVELSLTPRNVIVCNIPEESVNEESTLCPEDDVWYRARRISINTDGEFSSGRSTPAIRHEEGCDRVKGVSSSLSNEILENRQSTDRPHKSDTVDTRSRFESAKLFFQILEKTTTPPSRVPLLPSRAACMSYASSTDFDDTESECGEEIGKRQRRKRRLKISSEPTSDTETLSRLSGLRRRGTDAMFGGSERLPRRKVSERFHVRDLFKDVIGDTSSGFKGIPHREAVLAALRSVDNSRPVSPYEEQECPSSPGPQSYQNEYPHLPDTPPCLFKPRDMLQHGTFITRRDLINL